MEVEYIPMEIDETLNFLTNDEVFETITSIELNYKIKQILIENHIQTLKNKIYMKEDVNKRFHLIAILNSFKQRYYN
jgi:hypothetical protein